MKQFIRIAARALWVLAWLAARDVSAAPTAVTAPFNVDDGTRYVENPVMAASRTSGNFVVLWASAPSYTVKPELRARLYASGGIPFGPEFKVVDQLSIYPQLIVAMNAAGEFAAAWTTADGINARVFSASGLPKGPVFRLDDAGQPFVNTPGGPAFSLALASNGTVYGVWRSVATSKTILPSSVTTFGVFLRRFSSAGVAGDATSQRVDVPLGLFSDVAAPQVRVAGDGRAVVVWSAGLYVSAYSLLGGYERSAGSNSIFFRRYGIDGKAGLPVDLGVKAAMPGYLSADMNDQGEFVIGWATDTLLDATNTLSSQRFSANAVLKSSQRRRGCDQGYFPCEIVVALDGDGNSLLAGQASKTAGNYEQISVYSPSGALGLSRLNGEADITDFGGNSMAFGPAGSFIYAGFRQTDLDEPPFAYQRVVAQVFSLQ